jgi:hypothetical protein
VSAAITKAGGLSSERSYVSLLASMGSTTSFSYTSNAFLVAYYLCHGIGTCLHTIIERPKQMFIKILFKARGNNFDICESLALDVRGPDHLCE